MEYTETFNLQMPDSGATPVDFLNSHNANMEALDALPLPVESGSNSQLGYQKYSDGTMHVFGMVHYGTQYPCVNQIATASGFASAELTLNFPAGFINGSYALLVYVSADKNPDMTFATKSQGSSSITGNFVCPLNDGSAPNSKKLNVDAWGRWK